MPSSFGFASSCSSWNAVRMDARAKSLLKGKGTLDQDVGVLHDWRPSAWELSHHKDFSKEMVVSGRIVVRHVLDPKGKKVRVCLFTNELTSSPEELTELYTKRWNVETDLRSPKQTSDMETVRAQSPDMLAKELILGVAAYNIVRTIMAQATELAGVQPRQLSFARAKACIEIFAARGIVTPETIQQMLILVAARKQPVRKQKTSQEVWPQSQTFPSRKTPHEANSKLDGIRIYPAQGAGVLTRNVLCPPSFAGCLGQPYNRII